MDRRSVSDYETRELGWAQNAASALSSTDGRWAVVSTSVTALIAGSIAWLAAGTMPPATSHGFEAGRNPSLLPYELFMRLASHEKAAQANYASFGPTIPLTSHHAGLPLESDESAGDDSEFREPRRRYTHDHDGSRRHTCYGTDRCGRACGGRQSRGCRTRKSLRSENAARRTNFRSDLRCGKATGCEHAGRADHLLAAEWRGHGKRRRRESARPKRRWDVCSPSASRRRSIATSASRARPTAPSRERARRNNWSRSSTARAPGSTQASISPRCSREFPPMSSCR